MSEMIERVARKLFEREQSLPSDMGESEVERAQWAEYFRWDGPNYKGQEHFRSIARIAIEAMREPTKAMCGAGDGQDYPARFIWTAMIDAALGKVDA